MTEPSKAFNWILRLAIERVNQMEGGSASQEAVAATLNTAAQIVKPLLENPSGGPAD